MIRSMTGFARRECQGPWGILICELRTVNHRYLEVSLRLPEELRTIEADARQTIAAALRRGKVDANIHLRSAPGAFGQFEINPEALQYLLDKLRAVGGLVGPIAPLSSLDVLRWPGVIRESERDLSPALQATLNLLAEALAELNDTRAREGAKLRELVVKRCELIEDRVRAVRARLPEVTAKIRARVLERVSQLVTTIDKDRMEQELALYANRMDVDEELDRLTAHVAEVLNVLDANEPSGRRLDFLMQELNREANTLSSKSQDVEATRAAVDLKVAIEQMREQIQNIE